MSTAPKGLLTWQNIDDPYALDPEIWPKVRDAFAEALGLDNYEVEPGHKVIEELDAESEDFRDITFRLERAFDIEIPFKGVEHAVKTNLAEGDSVERAGILTDSARDRLQAALPEVPPGEFTCGLRIAQVEELLRVATFYNLVLHLLAGRSTGKQPLGLLSAHALNLAPGERATPTPAPAPSEVPMSVHPLLNEFGRAPDEEVLGSASVYWMQDDDWEQVYCEADLLVTNQRFGSHNEHSPFLAPVHEVAGLTLHAGGERVTLAFVNGVTQTYAGETVEELYHLLAAVRSRVIAPPAVADILEACQMAKTGQWKAAVEALRSACELEPFHPAVPAALAIALRRGGDPAEATDVLLGCVAAVVDVFPQMATLPTKFRMAGHHLHRLEQLSGDPAAPDAHPFTLCWQHLVATRRGDSATADRHLRNLIGRAVAGDPDDNAQLLAGLFYALEAAPAKDWGGIVDGLEAQFGYLRAAWEETDQSEPFPAFLSPESIDIFRRIAAFESDPCASAMASIELSRKLEKRYEVATDWRVVENWEQAKGERAHRTPFPQNALSNLAADAEGMEQVLDWLLTVSDLSIDAEHYWAVLRSGASWSPKGSPKRWWARIAERVPDEQPSGWLSALVAVEALLRDGRYREAREVLDKAYQNVACMLGDGRETYFRWASGLYGYFAALTDQDAAGVQMYSGLLRSHPGFEWTVDLAERLLGRPLQKLSTARSSVEQFESWLHRADRQLGLSGQADVREARAELQRAREARTLRVVVGGETSAGKSSFINALLGDRVLFVTAEEATAVPTAVSHGPEWSAVVVSHEGQVLDRIQAGATPNRDEKRRFSQFVERYSALTSSEARRVAEVQLTAPTVDLPRGVQLIDTPGFNAHAVRTKIAQDTLDQAHACIFVLDAGAALKSGEMAKIRWAQEAVGKTLFVINKMDRAIGDDDLDVDDSAAQDLLDRVGSDLASHLHVESVNLFAVCSLPEQKIRQMGLPDEAIEYARAIGDVHRRMVAMLSNSRADLIEYAASKVARVVAELALGQSYALLARQDERTAHLAYLLPPEPATFDQYLLSLVHETWFELRDTYVQNMIEALQTAHERADQRFVSGINGCADAEQLKRWVRGKVRPILNDFMAEAQAARVEDWSAIGEVVKSIVEEFFVSLSREFSGTLGLDLDALFAQSTPLPLPKPGKGLTKVIDECTEANALATGGGALAGAAIGTAIMPFIGTAIGGFLGAMAGGAVTEDPSEKVYEKLHEQLGKTFDKIAAALDADMEADETGVIPVLVGMEASIEAAREQFAQHLKVEVARAADLRAQAYREGTHLRRLAAEAWGHAQGFQR